MKNKPNRIAIPSKKPRRASGFTLVELLVTITIIVALAALIMAVTQNIRAKAQQANAMSSLRQVAAFCAAYSAENNGDINTLRFGGDSKEGGGSVWVKNTFWGRLQPYMFPDAATNNQLQLGKNINMGLDQLFNTPNADTMVNTVIAGTRIYHDTSGLPVPLSFNANLAPWNRFAKVSSFGDPAQIFYFTFGFSNFNEADGKAYEPMPTAGAAVNNNIYYLKDRKALAAFLDGHMESISPPIPSRRFE